jgi:agmatinase
MKEKTFHNFCGLDTPYSAYSSSRVVLLPVPFDRTSTWMKGSRRGPHALLNASRNLELYDIETDSQVYTHGLYTAKPVRAWKPEGMVEKVRACVSRFLSDGKFTVVLGGEHSVSIGTIAAHVEHFKSLSVLHLDAHSDRRDFYEGSRYNHACVMARVGEIIDTIVSVGIRSMDYTERSHLKKDHVFYAHDCSESNQYIEQVPSLLKDPVYITIDLDVFDSGIMPSTGTPEPGGLGWYGVIRLLREVTESRQVVGFDVVELCPSRNRAPDFLAAKLVYKILSFIFQKV